MVGCHFKSGSDAKRKTNGRKGRTQPYVTHRCSPPSALLQFTRFPQDEDNFFILFYFILFDIYIFSSLSSSSRRTPVRVAEESDANGLE